MHAHPSPSAFFVSQMLITPFSFELSDPYLVLLFFAVLRSQIYSSLTLGRNGRFSVPGTKNNNASLPLALVISRDGSAPPSTRGRSIITPSSSNLGPSHIDSESTASVKVALVAVPIYPTSLQSPRMRGPRLTRCGISVKDPVAFKDFPSRSPLLHISKRLQSWVERRSPLLRRCVPAQSRRKDPPWLTQQGQP